jgi:hypothetical protein
VGTGQLEKGWGGDRRDLGVRCGHGVHGDTWVVRGRFRDDESDRRDPRGQRERASERVARLTSGPRGTTRESAHARKSSAPTSQPH